MSGTRPAVDLAPGDTDTQWEWEISGTEVPSSPGSMEHTHRATGLVEVECEGAGEALEWFVQHGWWDCVDQSREVTVTVRPARGVL